MASNDIISTNVPSKVPTTDTEEYPVQHELSYEVFLVIFEGVITIDHKRTTTLEWPDEFIM